MIFVSAVVKGPFTTENGDVYGINALWNDNGSNFRRAYSEPDYPQMVTDFAEWPDANGDYPDPTTYAAQAHWVI